MDELTVPVLLPMLEFSSGLEARSTLGKSHLASSGYFMTKSGLCSEGLNCSPLAFNTNSPVWLPALFALEAPLFTVHREEALDDVLGCFQVSRFR